MIAILWASGGTRATANQRRRGFTLLEVLVAIAVLGTISTVFVSLFTSSLDLGRNSRDTRLAAQLAEAQLQAILQEPGAFQWRLPETEAVGALFPIALGEDDPKAGNPTGPPVVLPAVRAANEQESALYERFRWRAFGRLPATQAHYYEVMVEVRWTLGGREHALHLTGALQRGAVEAAR